MSDLEYINLVLLSIGFITLALFATQVFIVRLHCHLTSGTTTQTERTSLLRRILHMPARNKKKKRQPKPPTVTERVDRIETNLETAGEGRPVSYRLRDQDRVIETLESELTSTMAENVVMRAKIKRLMEALGGVLWKDVHGVLRPITLLSTSHLKNILAGGFAKGHSTRLLIASELKRREVDRRYRSPLRRIWRAFSNLLKGSETRAQEITAAQVVDHIEEEPLPPGGYPPVEPGNIHPGVRKAKRLKKK